MLRHVHSVGPRWLAGQILRHRALGTEATYRVLGSTQAIFNLEVVAVPAFGLLLLKPALGPALPGLIAVLLLADAGLAVIGTLVAALAVRTRSRDLIGPLIALPLLVPVILFSARAVTPLLQVPAAQALPARWLWPLALYDLVFGLIAYAVFEFLLED